MAALLDLSTELLHDILLKLNPGELSRVSQCCRSLRTFINESEILWKDLYLSIFDDPREHRPDSKVFWQPELSRMWKLHKLLASEDVAVKRTNFAFIATAIEDLVATSGPRLPSSNANFLRQHFDKTRTINKDAILCGSSLFLQAGSTEQQAYPEEHERHMSAKLHVLHGVADEAEKSEEHPIHAYSRSRVYDLRRYTDDTLWGPFMDDGSQRVDWENLENLMIVLTHNVQSFCSKTYGPSRPIWNVPFAGLSPNSYRSKAPFRIHEDVHEDDMGIMEAMYIITPATAKNTPQVQRVDSLLNYPGASLDEQDPYGVAGTWARIVCFLDYTDLYHFNFENEQGTNDGPRGPIRIQEAIRFITLNLRVRRIEAPGPADGQALPVVHFTGTSRSMHASWDPNANSKIRGTVRLTPEGYVRWTSFSIFHGEERWRSECIQVGDLRSARGMLGTWFDKNYTAEGPVGPTAFWKISDNVIQSDHGAPLLPLS